jgi:hypothetical protein
MKEKSIMFKSETARTPPTSPDVAIVNAKFKTRADDYLSYSPDTVASHNDTANPSIADLSISTLFKDKEASPRRKSFLPNNCYDVIVIGAGFSGVFATQQAYKELGKAKIALIHSNGLLSPESSSQNECFKMHTGLHYVKDRQTAESCLRNTVEMAHAFYDLILDKDKPDAPSRRGRHYLVNNVDSPSVEQVKAECENLKHLYAELIVDYPDAEKIFGSPEKFITYLAPGQYAHIAPSIPFEKTDGDIENISVTLGIETPECQIDINRFKQYFEDVFVYLRDRVKLFGEHAVVRVSHAEDFLGYAIETSRFDKENSKLVKETFYTKAVVNCTWQNIDGIDSHLNFQQNDSLFRIQNERLKKIISRPASSKVSSSLDNELDILSKEIIEGTVKSAPFLSETKITGNGSGEDGIQKRDLCYLSFSGTHISDSYKPAQKVAKLVHRQFIIRDTLEGLILEIMKKNFTKNDPQIYPALRHSLTSHLLSELSKSGLTKTVDNLPIDEIEPALTLWKGSIDKTDLLNQYRKQFTEHQKVMSSSRISLRAR